jgi:UPF0716 protein FxsA
MLPLAILFILWPIVELTVLIRIGRATSITTAILLVIVPALLGAFLAKREGLKTYRRIQQELASGHIPGDQLVEGLLILVAGTLLITPGLISDILGILLLVPPLRKLARQVLKRWFRKRFTIMHFGSPAHGGPAHDRSAHGGSDDDFVDVQAHEVNHGQIGQNEGPS